MTKAVTLRVLERRSDAAADTTSDPSSLGTWYKAVRDTPIDELSTGDICRACRQQLFPHEIVPEALRRLLADPMSGDLYDGELLVSLKSVPKDYWIRHGAEANTLLKENTVMHIQRNCCRGLTVLVMGLAAAAASAAEPLARFRATEKLGLAWPKTLVTYRVSFRPGVLRDANVQVLDAAEKAQACQLWRIERHSDGSIAAARASFFAELPAGGSFDYRLVPGGTAAPDGQLNASNSGGFLTLQNNAVAIRLPAEGETKHDPPLAFGSEHGEMLKLYGRQAAAGIAPGIVPWGPTRRLPVHKDRAQSFGSLIGAFRISRA
jgi:hypothetical protein